MPISLLRSTGYRIEKMSYTIQDIKQVLNVTFDLSSLSTITTKPEIPLLKPKRCQHIECKTKLMLTDFACKCKGWYCGTHRYSESHNCQFDYIGSSKALLESRLNKVTGQKLEHI